MDSSVTTLAAIGFAIALFISWAIGPAVRRQARRTGFTDHPDAGRKLQLTPVAYGGGLLILAGLTGSLAVMGLWKPSALIEGMSNLSQSVGRFGFLFLSCIILALVGAWDDRFGMRGRHKLGWQVLVACLAVFSGLMINTVELFGFEIPLGIFGPVLTMIWILGSINSFNLIDGVDGLAGSVGLVISLAVGTISVMRGDVASAVFAFSLAGGLVGFLRLNRPPATMYLGDSGSMLIGLVLGTVALHCCAKEATTVAASPLIAIWAILILDSVAAVARRKLTGRSIYQCDRGHIHHRLLAHGFSPGQTTLLIVGLCTITSLGAIASYALHTSSIGIVTALVVVVLLALTRVFGHAEFSLVGRRLLRLGRNSVPGGNGGNGDDGKFHLQGNGDCDHVWEAVIESIARFDLSSARLNLHVPRRHEDFFASWRKPGFDSDCPLWQLERPFVMDGVTVGSLAVQWDHGDDSGSGRAMAFLEFAESLVPQIEEFVAEVALRDEPSLPSLPSIVVHPVLEPEQVANVVPG